MANITKYLAKRARVRPFQHWPDVAGPVRQAVVIPVLDEQDALPLTLASLATNPGFQLASTVVVVVVNNRPANSTVPAPTAENAETLTWLAATAPHSPLRLAWIDAATPGNELPIWGGVGLARKIGGDSVLAHLATHAPSTAWEDFVIFSLDADTLVEPSYLAAGDEFRVSGKAGGVLPFRHQPASSPELQAAINAYERYLHYYVNALRWAGSPYAFHTIGSGILCRASSYVEACGFPARRLAGEDFYFCQELAKTGGICELRNTVVQPSPRISNRVPFGTGPRMAEALLQGKRDFVAYDFRCFQVLRELLSTVTNNLSANADTIMSAFPEPLLKQFLEAREFSRVWAQFQHQFKTPAACHAAFHRWFDGFTTLKLIHYFTDRQWPRVPLPAALSAWHARGDK